MSSLFPMQEEFGSGNLTSRRVGTGDRFYSLPIFLGIEKYRWK